MRTNQGFSRGLPLKSAVLLVAAFLVGGATVDYRPYEGNATQYEGTESGTTLTVDGVDFWSNGTPPRKFFATR